MFPQLLSRADGRRGPLCSSYYRTECVHRYGAPTLSTASTTTTAMTTTTTASCLLPTTNYLLPPATTHYCLRQPTATYGAASQLRRLLHHRDYCYFYCSFTTFCSYYDCSYPTLPPSSGATSPSLVRSAFLARSTLLARHHTAPEPLTLCSPLPARSLQWLLPSAPQAPPRHPSARSWRRGRP